MLLAYIDEIGETGAFVSKTHARYKTSPAFGYAGFVVPDVNARRFGQMMDREKRAVFAPEIAGATHPGRWEKKGSEVFHFYTAHNRPEQIRVFNALKRKLCEKLGGALFYYADEKPIGTPKETGLDKDERETHAMREALNRLCTFADRGDQQLLVMIDQINEKDRAKRLPLMYGHILGRAAEHVEMKRIVEPPMHVDSALSSNIQFADWVAAAVTRGIERQLLVTEVGRNEWVPRMLSKPLRRAFTAESKLHFAQRFNPDMHGGDVFSLARPLAGRDGVRRLGDAVSHEQYRAIKLAAERGSQRPGATW
ncbi:DUF3800 domain-containing protein [Rathayibacter rathayi]|uniref:DUF3800 domain-containing protein n=1 Tax=Rathayibacter rathayi TaxID=33887 RepID=A0ABD6W8I6_RATRA|nr:DUF3800 domain-containing protein [Rathayibacter rathayi]AZZ47965.1 DUF3800 domain-containing protein [Rathayibacter rathayi]MWV74771.1 DUF3800 domain-containing protein [Rathayibacter rathayi NCPPB 2980 = VKM Ac-1601]PPF14231.1 DUF3800 domain-containing protein [Rathayibacter rathayi]PPF25967.1 DUF3800 domain-containing protein [Rathayibacter rathayi]PPF50596.1 DUF3800 domain-containing protein [Rathayibacter rathayi]